MTPSRSAVVRSRSRYLSWAAAVAGLVSIAGAVAEVPTYPQFEKTSPPWSNAANLVDSHDPLVVRGAYLATAGDCIACHTAPGGEPYAGGLALESSFGAIHSTNITPDRQHGIGDYGYEDFARALREGIAKDGRHLYPAMPYPSYSKITDDDLHALFAYFQHGVKASSRANEENHLDFPFGMRGLMIGWNLLFRPSGVYQPDASRSAAWNRGAYLVQGLEHCGACHTPRGVTQQEKALDDHDGTHYLSGAALDGWHAPNLRSDARGGLGRWEPAAIVGFLRAGRNAHTAAFGAMSEAVGDSTQYLSDDDLQAIAVYLKALSPGATSGTPDRAAMAGPTQAANALHEGHVESAGARVYLDNCNACHRSDGTGATGVFPALAGNSAVMSADATSLIHVVLSGSHMPSTAAAPAPLGMPGFGWRLADQQVADVLTFVRGSWGNDAPPVKAEAVRQLRGSL
jgi:mono/diheme cytochrome c family protein